MPEPAASPFVRSRYDLEFEERFDGSELDPERWVAHYLPQWTTPDRSAARYELDDGFLRLRIDAVQPPWRPEDGELRVSNIQSGTWSGPNGSKRGQHRHRQGLTVRTPQPARRLYTPRGGAVEATLRAVADPATMLAFWLIGFEEESPEHSGEICVVELFGNAIGPGGSELSIGVKAHHDPNLVDDMVRLRLPIDATAWHTYGADWSDDQIRFHVNGKLIHASDQRITYPMQLMIDLFEFSPDGDRDPTRYPKSGDVRAVRGYRPRR